MENRIEKGDLTAVRRQHCLQLANKFSTNGLLKCALCCKELRLQMERPRMNDVDPMIDHVLTHLKKRRYACKRCSVPPFISFGGIWGHVKNVHGKGKRVSVGYVDRVNEFHEEVIAALSKCFGRSNIDEDALVSAEKERLR